jgi:acyl-CoA reductase-like NAD-dependent aldehyde dehydrogenase
MLIKNPKNDELIRELKRDTPAELKSKLERARRAQPGWAKLDLKERLGTIERFRAALVKERDQLALTLTREMGKPISQAQNELSAMPGRIGFFLEHTAAVLANEEVHRETADSGLKLTEIIQHEPLGVVLNISAWNYPWFVGSNVFVPALLTGNSVIYKPSEHATLTGLEIERLLHESGVPRDVFSAVVGEGDVGAELLELDFDGVFFTGSYRTGKKIAERVAGRLLKVGLELGGKDPTYVADDVDVKAAAESLADGAMYNAGQSCCSVERIYVHAGVAEAFQDAFVETVRGFKIGDPEDPTTYIGPLARHDQLDELDAQVADALEKGARLRLGGKRLATNSAYFEPTVLVDVTDEMRVMREESFGPIIGIALVQSDDEAVARMNDSDYGLTAGVYTRDQRRAESLLSRVNAGSVYWNCCDRVSPRLPWTGRGHSGMGSTLSTHGIRSFLQPKAWHLRTP